MTSTLALAMLMSCLAAMPARQDASSPSATEGEDGGHAVYEAREALDLVLFALGEDGRDAAREMLCAVVQGLSAPGLGADPADVDLLLELDRLSEDLGCLPESGRLREAILELRQRALPAEHPSVLDAQKNLAWTRGMLGDLEGARELQEEVVAVRTRTLGPEHSDVLAAKSDLAITRKWLGDVWAAREIEEEVLQARTKLQPPDHLDVLQAKMNLAQTLQALGEYSRARQLAEEALEGRSRLLAPDNREVWFSKTTLANVLRAQGDLSRARQLEEEVVESQSRLLPPEHPDLLAVRKSLGITRRLQGDLPGARAALEEVLEIQSRFMSADHPDLVATKEELGVVRLMQQDFDGTRELMEEVVAGWRATLPPGHVKVLQAQGYLAWALCEEGDLQRASELMEEVVPALSKALPADHPIVLAAKGNLGTIRAQRQDLSGALELQEEILAARKRMLPSGHTEILTAELTLAWTRYRSNDQAGAQELVLALLADLRARAAGLVSYSPREAREAARAGIPFLYEPTFLGAVDGEYERIAAPLFATLETLRNVSIAIPRSNALAEFPELRRASAEKRSRLHDLVSVGPTPGQSIEAWQKEILRLADERDRAERELRGFLLERDVFVGEIDPAALAALLPPESAVVSFLRYPPVSRVFLEPGAGQPEDGFLMAFLLTPDGRVQCIRIEAAAELGAQVESWRSALGRASGERGIRTVEPAAEEELQALGAGLRERILDPILARAPGVHTLHVLSDDFLHLVPLDALPSGDGFVGDRLAIRNEISLTRLLRPDASPDEDGELTLVGGIDYDAEAGASATVAPPLDPATLRASVCASSFAFLEGTTGEVSSIGALYGKVFEREAKLLTGAAATKAALLAAAPRTRYLHLATHGWFAPEAVRSQLDTLAEPAGRSALQQARETLAGFAPETLCGLALAGASRGQDALGSVPGLLTAEELSSFDLHECELAVLSACETNVGVRRAGQGIQSLQTALHAAGARTAITSLWMVDDEATRRLFELFYEKLWKERLGKSDALWEAKRTLRAEGHPLRDWAGWVLTGDPN